MRNTILLTALAVSTVIPAAAQAQRVPGAAIAIVDTDRLYRECTACRSAQTQLQGQIQTLQTRQQTLANQLRPERESLQKAVQALGSKQPDAALTQRIQAFQQREQTAAQELQQSQTRIQSIQANVVRQIDERVRPIINQVMAARGANIAVDVDATLGHAAGLDVTADVLARLNTALPAVSMTPLPQQQQQQQPRPQGR